MLCADNAQLKSVYLIIHQLISIIYKKTQEFLNDCKGKGSYVLQIVYCVQYHFVPRAKQMYIHMASEHSYNYMREELKEI
jgi:hypothetical protein